MLFDRKPKFRREDFYDRKRELQLLSKGIEAGEGLIVVYGVRRIGKTSLVYVGLSELDVLFIPIDIRRFLVDPSFLAPQTLLQVADEVLKQYERLQGRVKEFFGKLLEYVESLDLKVLKLKIKEKEKVLPTRILERANRWAREQGTRVIIVLDEAQELRRNPQWRSTLAWSIDTLENITFIVTGSEIGVLNDFLKLSDPKSPLFGRARLEIKLDRFSREQSIDFLKKGFNEVGMAVREEEIENAVDRLNGIVGWLSLYGYYRVTYGLDHVETLNRVEEEAVKLLSSELEKLVRYSPRRYVAILWAISLGLKSWSTIKHFAEGIVGHMPDNRFGRLLQNLVKYSFVEKTEDGEYRIIDPLLPKAIEQLRRRYGL